MVPARGQKKVSQRGFSRKNIERNYIPVAVTWAEAEGRREERRRAAAGRAKNDMVGLKVRRGRSLRVEGGKDSEGKQIEVKVGVRGG